MDLPNLLDRIRHKEEILRRLLAIEITPTAIKSAVWQVQGNHTEIVSVGSIQAWETDDVTDLITAIDTSISEAFAGLETEPNEVVFGLPETWVGSGGIAEGKRPLLKEISHKLALKPVGFVVTVEAIIQHLRDLEGGPPSAILINLGLDNVAVSIVYLGGLQGTQVVGRSGAIGSDVEEGLARFPRMENLPSRMILYDSREDLESAKQDLIGHDWQAHLPFLHFPKIEALAKDFSIRAIALSGGQEVAQSLGYTTASAENPLETDDELLTPSPKLETKLIPDLADDFGFATISPNQAESPEPAPLPLKKTQPKPDVPKRKPLHFIIHRPRVPASMSNLFHWGLRLPTRLIAKRPHLSLPKAKVLLILPILVLAIILTAAFAYWHYVTAEVRIMVSPEPLTKTITFILNPQLQVLDVQKSLLPAKKESVSVSDSLSASVTGSKTVGDRAKGSVTLYNRTSLPKNFSAGTTIKYQNLRFTLDKDVSLASASTKYNPDFSVTTEPSKTTVAVTAVDIGEAYNLGVNTQFTVANFSTDNYIASNPSPLSGGSSRQVPAVSESDRKQLKDQLTSQIIEAVKNQVSAKAAGQQVVTTDKQTITEEKYSAKVGEETDKITLNLTLSQVVYTYNLTDVTLLAQHVAATEMLPNYQIQAGGTRINLLNTLVNDDNTATVKAEISLSLLPILDSSTIAKEITGKTPKIATQFLTGVTGYSDSTIKIKPTLPELINTLPHVTGNIHIIIESK